MLTPSRLWRRLWALVTSRTLDDDLDEEIRFHLDMETEQRVRQGMDPASAREAARRDFGIVTHHREETRDARGTRALEELLRDLRIGSRVLLSRPTFAGVSILTLAIGIGATSALGAAVYHVLLKPYPFPEADRIVAVWQKDTRSTEPRGEFSPGNFVDLSERARSLDLIAAAEPWSVDWIGPEGPERFDAALVTRDAFPIQGLRPLLGRAFRADEFQAGNDGVVVLSEQLWRTRFGADSSLVGRTLVLDSVPRVVIGVMSDDALRPYAATLWLPKLLTARERTARQNAYWTVMARLAPNTTLEQANDELRAISRQLATEFPASNRHTEFAAERLREAMTSGARPSLLVLLGAVALVLLIACVNVATLQLGEAIRRRRELAIRTAIGAGRGRLMRQLLTESVLLAVIGAGAGLLLAAGGIAAIRGTAPADLWMLRSMRFDAIPLVLAGSLALACGLVIAATPLVMARRIRLADSLAAGGRGGISLTRRRGGRALVMAEVAIALVLLVGSGLLIRSLTSLLRVDRGFRVANVLATNVQAWSYYPTSPQRAVFVRDALQAIEAVPGVERAGMTSALPLSWPIGLERTRVTVEGQHVAPGDEAPAIRTAAISPGYLEVMDIPVLRGRAIAAADDARAPMVALVSREFERRFIPDGDAVGKRLTFGFMSAPLVREVVGVVGDLRHEGLHAAVEPAVYLPHAQGATGAIHFVMRTAGEPALLDGAVRQALRQLNGVMPIVRSSTMEAQLGQSLRERRFQLGLLSAFSITALLLAAIGIYGVVSRSTGERTHEIGVRMAVGAVGSEVRWMVLRGAGGIALAGIAVGLGASVLLTRYMRGMLFGVTPLDPVTYAAAAAVLLGAAVLASWIPARRASTVDPVIALRSD